MNGVKKIISILNMNKDYLFKNHINIKKIHKRLDSIYQANK